VAALTGTDPVTIPRRIHLPPPAVTYELRVYVRRTADSADEVPMSSAPLRVEFKLAAT